MTGFKSGASSSPYDSDDDTTDDEDDTTTNIGSSTADQTTTSARTNNHEQRRVEDDEETSETASTSSGLPWIYRRSSITDGRAKTVQLHLQESTRERQTDALSDAESELGESVKKADLREAALLVGMDHIGEVADVLREWGYDFE
ncbi:hypothetical protein [Natronorubrum halophilum]|uniref:hypothetical protein n=1 Tax=Natronorubrum halophilum TaxID=1702106 RepID=UPI000EF706E5|nr:hypothetical protein [Natronorubrum halophilum]